MPRNRGFPLFALGLAAGYVLCSLQLSMSSRWTDYTGPPSSLSFDVPAVSSLECEPRVQTRKSSYRSPPMCNCLNASATKRFCSYCSLSLISVHKMGVTLNKQIASKVFNVKLRSNEISKHEQLGYQFRRFFENPPHDYRHVLITRNFYSALISGYLYHKDGRECWVDWFGRNSSKIKMWLYNNTKENWEARINSTSTRQIQSWPPGKGRDLCTYLSEESEEDGMRVYMEWAITMFYQPLHEFWIRRKEKESATQQKTIHICYEDEEKDFLGSMRRIADFIGIAAKHYTFEQLLEGSSGHQTQKDPNLFSRLRDIILRLDNQLFNNSIASWGQMFNCSR